MDGQNRRTCSSALLAAQEKLTVLRQQYRADGKSNASPLPHHGRPTQSVSTNKALLQPLPSHLGWQSERLTSAIKTSQRQKEESEQRTPPMWPLVGTKSQALSIQPPHSLPAGRQVKLYPDIALGALRQEQVTAARIWLLLQHIDANSCGWVAVETARRMLTENGNGLRVCGWRQLRKVLARGDGLFWLRSNGRIWIRSVAKVAASLQVFRLNGRPVSLPVSVLLQPIGTVRAHFYASFHSSRTRDGANSTCSKPIARATLERLSHVGRQTQRQYEKRISVRRQFNFAIGGKSTPEELQARAWKHGSATFTFRDHLGGKGQRGNQYVAWQLPNNYFGPHARCPRGRQKRINRELADLFLKGMTGNGNHSMRNSRPQGKLFCENGFSAAAEFNRNPSYDIYWPSRRRNRGRFQLWHLLACQESNK